MGSRKGFAMSAADNAALARTIYRHFDRGEIDAALALADPDIVVTNVPWGDTFNGHEGFRAFMEGWKTMDPDSHVEILHQLAGEEGVTNECVFHATHVGPLNPPTGEIPPTGKTVAVPFCEVWRIANGKLTSLTNYADGVTIMMQLGLMEAPAAAGN